MTGKQTQKGSMFANQQGELFPEAAPQVARQRTAAWGQLVPRFTFDTFVVGASNQFAHAAARAVAGRPAKHYNPLFLYGGVGLGKTHLVSAIGHHIRRNQPQVQVAYLTAEEFTTQLIDSLRKERMDAFRSACRRVDVLILEDVQFLAGRERTQEEFFHTFNTLYANHRQIILTSDKVPRDIGGLEERLRNRFEWGLIADIQPPDMETRVAILERKAEIDGLRLPREVAMYVASVVKTNVRELEGCLTRLGLYASLRNRPITLEFAEEVLPPVLLPRSQNVTVEKIQATVARHFSLHLRDLLSRSRARQVVVPRQIAMFLTRELTNASFPAIGDAFGGRDHSTVIHACALIKRRVTCDQDLQRAITKLTDELRQNGDK